jgi:hypothetical protein
MHKSKNTINIIQSVLYLYDQSANILFDNCFTFSESYNYLNPQQNMVIRYTHIWRKQSAF